MSPAAVTDCPAVSVVMPVRNGESTIEEAVRSVLAQTFRNFELIVVDDGSSDGTPAVLETLAAEDERIRIITRAPSGIVASLNAGIAEARAPLIARMDADDICKPERFERQVAHLSSHPNSVAVGTGIQKVDQDLQPRRSRHRHCYDTPPMLAARALSFPPQCPQLAHPTAMIRTDALRAAGGYRDGALAPAQDRDLWWRLSRIGPIHVIEDVLLIYRVHKSSLSRSARRETMVANLLADFSAIAAALGRDDADILASLPQDLSSQDLVRRYEALLGTAYPLRDYMMYLFVRERVQPLAEEGAGAAMLWRIAVNCMSRPLHPAPWRVLGCYFAPGYQQQRSIN